MHFFNYESLNTLNEAEQSLYRLKKDTESERDWDEKTGRNLRRLCVYMFFSQDAFKTSDIKIFNFLYQMVYQDLAEAREKIENQRKLHIQVSPLSMQNTRRGTLARMP